jgi:hypothetical protein
MAILNVSHKTNPRLSILLTICLSSINIVQYISRRRLDIFVQYFILLVGQKE